MEGGFLLGKVWTHIYFHRYCDNPLVEPTGKPLGWVKNGADPRPFCLDSKFSFQDVLLVVVVVHLFYFVFGHSYGTLIWLHYKPMLRNVCTYLLFRWLANASECLWVIISGHSFFEKWMLRCISNVLLTGENFPPHSSPVSSGRETVMLSPLNLWGRAMDKPDVIYFPPELVIYG